MQSSVLSSIYLMTETSSSSFSYIKNPEGKKGPRKLVNVQGSPPERSREFHPNK